jgi:tetratricopeptide (TPR) repeat protein
MRKTEAAANALRRVVELAPEDRKARLDLARLILETRQAPDEAARHAEWLVTTDPRDSTALIQLAACREAQSRTDEAIALLDRVIAEFPPNARAYHIRGRLEMARGADSSALPFLRRAAELDRSDPDALYSLFLCLQRAGAPEQAAEAEKNWRRCSDDLRRARELGRLIAASPHDPELRREMGELFLRNGRDAEGLHWLESALAEQPTHAPTHRVLAAYFDRTGQPERAASHRSFLSGPPPNGVAPK